MTDSAAKIIADCDEVMGRHSQRHPNEDRCYSCGLEMPCDAYASARDLRDAVEALGKLSEFPSDSDHPSYSSYSGVHKVARSALTTIAERGEAGE